MIISQRSQRSYEAKISAFIKPMKSRANLIKNKNLQLIKTNLKLLIKKFLILLTAMIMAIMMAGRNLFESDGRNCKLAR